MRGGWSASLSITTTTCGCTARWVTSRPRTGWKAGTWKSTKPDTRSSKQLVSGDGNAGNNRRCACEPRLGKTSKRVKHETVHPEGRALLGSNPIAAVDSYTAGLGGLCRPGRPPAGTTTKRKIPGGLGDSVPQVEPTAIGQQNGKTRWQKVLKLFQPSGVSR